MENHSSNEKNQDAIFTNKEGGILKIIRIQKSNGV